MPLYFAYGANIGWIYFDPTFSSPKRKTNKCAFKSH